MAPRSALSYSSVRTYLECALRWKFLYIDELPEAPHGYFSFGRTVHSVLEELLKPLVVPSARRIEGGAMQRTLDDWRSGGKAGPKPLPSRLELLKLYDAAWIRDGYQSPEEENRYKALGEEMLVAYHDDLLRAPPDPVSVEEHLSAQWNGVAVHGYIDRIDRTPSGGLEILDYKTSRELSQADAEESDQLSLYQVLVEQNYPEKVEQLTLFHLRSRTPRSVPRRDASVLEGVHDRFTRAGDGIRSQSYEPSPGRHCSRCEFRSLCPEFRLVPEPDQAPLLELVDRFHRLRLEEEHVEDQLRATAESLHREAERLGVHRIPGSDRVAIRKREEVWRFREESVGPILAEHGLEGQVRADDAEAVRRLTQYPTLDAGLRRRLTEAGGRQIRWYWVLEDGSARP
ncbi:MAG: PD-(D/E)XK nuclease family protein [Thermoplasmata archaeon]|nr:PD-(D/E)XK nuclease family protein [Thermoplasmata archaeon]